MFINFKNKMSSKIFDIFKLKSKKSEPEATGISDQVNQVRNNLI